MAWSPTQYLKFENERSRPPRELLAQVPLDRICNAIDLGCGPGNSTELLIERFGPAGISGVDSDRNMLEAARKRLPDIPFTEADLSTWRPDEPVDLLFANALFQWLPDHLEIFDSLMDSLNPGGVLAIQMPDNLDEPSHRLMEETAHDGPWGDAFQKHCARRKPLSSPAIYYNRLAPKASRVEVWHTFYHHPLENAAAIVEMVKSTGLRRYQ